MVQRCVAERDGDKVESGKHKEIFLGRFYKLACDVFAAIVP